MRTNLAAADIVIDMRLRGPGSADYPEGFIDLSETYAKLPFLANRHSWRVTDLRLCDTGGGHRKCELV